MLLLLSSTSIYLACQNALTKNCNLVKGNTLLPVFQDFVNNKFSFSFLVIKFSTSGKAS